MISCNKDAYMNSCFKNKKNSNCLLNPPQGLDPMMTSIRQNDLLEVQQIIGNIIPLVSGWQFWNIYEQTNFEYMKTTVFGVNLNIC